jgi:DNA-binding NtrC family response regulator
MGYIELAEDCLQYAMEVAHDHESTDVPLLYLELGRLYDLKGDWRQALTAYEKALGLPHGEPVDTGRILNGIGLQYYALGSWDKARAYYDRARSLSDSPVGRHCAGVNLAVLFGERGKREEALKLERQLLLELEHLEDEFGYYCVQSNMLYKYATFDDEAALEKVLATVVPALNRPGLRRLRFGVTDSRLVFALGRRQLDRVESLLAELRRHLGDGSATSSPGSEGWVAIRDAMFLRACGQPRAAVGRLSESLLELGWDALSRATADYELALCLKEAGESLAVDYGLKALSRFRELGYDKHVIEQRRKQLFDRTARPTTTFGSDFVFEGFVGQSLAACQVRSTLARVARVDATVLILGESGTGKTFLANLIHEGSARRAGPFVRFDCTCHEEGLMESLLFGHRRGAFTGAVMERKGLVELATGGTLLIDEVADLPLALQGKLLTILEEGTYRPVGGTVVEKANVRFLVATNKSLEAEVRDGRFREDLFFRLGALKIVIPSLRGRSEDIPHLAATCLAMCNARFGTAKRLAASAWAVLARQQWPGNVRELQKVIERAIVLSDGDEIHAHDLGLEQAVERQADTVRTLDDVERDYIVHVLTTVAGNRSRAARLLGMKRTTLYSRMAALGI